MNTKNNIAATVGTRSRASVIWRTAFAAAAFCVATAPMASWATAKSTRLVCSGYTGSTALENFQALVKLSATDDGYGFSYSDLADSASGSDLWFADADGNAIPHEIDTWNTSGDSFLWVRIPVLTNNAAIVMHWGDSASRQTASGNVWDGFVGVWHMNGTGTTAETDSTANGLSATPLDSSSAAVALDTTTGCVGAGRAISADGRYFSVGSSSSPYYNYITTKKQFSMSGWCNLSSTPSGNGYQRLFCGMSSSSLNSWDVWREGGSTLGIRSGDGSAQNNNTGYGVSLATGGNDWHYLTVVWDGSSATVYNNGGSVDTKTLRENTHPNGVFTIGGRAGTSNRSFVGSFDEVRMYDGVLSADRVAADYMTMNAPTEFLVSAASAARIATWTGAVDGDVSKPGNWSLTIDGEAATETLPTTVYTVVLSGANVNMQVPSGTTLACAAVRIQNCTFTADCDWRGLSVTPSIVGTADLNGKNLYLNDLSASMGSSFTNTVDGTVSEVRFTPTTSKTSESDFISDLANLTTYSNARIALVDADSYFSASSLSIGSANGNHPVFVQSNGTVNVSGTINLGVSAYGAYEQHGGDVIANKLAVGTTSGGTGEYTITNGTLTATSTTTQIGSNGGKGIFKASGNAGVTFGNAELTYSDGETTFNIGDDASVKVNGYLMLARGYGPTRAKSTINQTGGKVETTGEVQIGFTGAGTYNISSGSLVAGSNLQVGTGRTGSTIQGVGRLNQYGGDVVCNNYLSVGRYGNATGYYTMTGGTYCSPNQNGIVGEEGPGTLDVSGTGVMFFPKGLRVGHKDVTASKGTVRVHDGGRIVTSSLYHDAENAAAATATAEFAGGTVVLTNAESGVTLLSGFDSLTLGDGGITVDTAGHNASLNIPDTFSSSDYGSALVKDGEGALTIAALPDVSEVRVNAGSLIVQSGGDNTASSTTNTLAHRWSFNGDFMDSVGGVTATILNGSVTFTNNAAAVLPGGDAKGAIKLGTGVLGSGNATIEIWGKHDRNLGTLWSYLAAYGDDSNSIFGWAWRAGNNWYDNAEIWYGGSKLAGRNGIVYRDEDGLRREVGKEYHLAVTFTDNGDGTTNVRFSRRDTSTDPTTVVTYDFNNVAWSIADGVSSWVLTLGHNPFSNSTVDAAATYNEVRVWHSALSDEALAVSVIYGPDATDAQIAELANPGTARTLNVASGARVSLGGALTQPVVSGSGTISGGRVNVTEAISPGGDGAVGTLTILGGTVTGEIRLDVGDKIVVSGGTLDISGATVTLLDPSNIGEFIFIESINGGSVTGTPTVDTDTIPSPWKVLLSGDRAKITKSGIAIFIR